MKYVSTDKNATKSRDTIASMLADWPKTKAYVCPCLLSPQTAYQDNPVDLAHEDFLDLSICYYLRAPGRKATNICWIPQGLLDASGISKTDLKAQAMQNLENDGYHIQDMNSILELENESCSLPLFILTNQGMIFGAAGLLHSKLLAQFAETVKSDFYILPSSIHELLLMPASDGLADADMLNNIVCDVNMAQVKPSEQLSNNAYYYDRNTKEIRIAAS